jgi:2-polyprenyl-3-methyl-5-hydroxy-6-metoxy-1,4-benzoquinol methylase
VSSPLGSASNVKDGGYYGNIRRDLLGELPRTLVRVLDVGCGEGAGAALLREGGATHITGVEPAHEAAALAGMRYDDVLVAPIEVALTRLAGPFDVILLHDVLEHLVDPAMVVRELRSRAAPGAHVQVSVPNARHVSLLWDLFVRGTFGYAEWGHRDSTHLRWFTRGDIVALLESCGWSVVSTSHPPLGRSRALDRLTRGRSTEFLVGQWYVLARGPA